MNYANYEYHHYHQYITTPNFPSNYGPNKSCTWVLKAPFGRQLRIHQFSYTLGSYVCGGDGLEIYDGTVNETRNILAKLCGNGYTEVIESTSNVVILKFVSDGVVSELDIGFKIKYSVSCNIFTNYKQYKILQNYLSTHLKLYHETAKHKFTFKIAPMMYSHLKLIIIYFLFLFYRQCGYHSHRRTLKTLKIL